ncbi:MAG: family 10 glycosylhydrolase [Phycisphaerae bacterium]|nr:family 10 glycosylhydrolase [Phycisphaerae bacterium]
MTNAGGKTVGKTSDGVRSDAWPTRRAMLAVIWAVVCALAVLAPSARAGSEDKFVGLWVTRWDYRTAADVRDVMDRAAAAGFTDVVWQVRGQADAYYQSAIEPWGDEILKGAPDGAATPGFDPLAVAVELAHASGLRLHAWVNVMPMWKGKAPPTNQKHLIYTHPEWRLVNQRGEVQPLNDHYVIVNPVLPEVHDYLVGVFKDIVTRYDVDGLHMDYVRFVSELMGKDDVYPADEKSQLLFKQATGREGISTPEDKAALKAYVKQRITDLVVRIRKEAVGSREGVVFSAAIWRRPDLARDTYLQDSPAWLNDKVLDLGMPMIYTDKDEQFTSDLKAWLAATPEARLAPGLGVYLIKPAMTPSQIGITRELVGTPPSIAIFAYSSLFESADPNQNKSFDAAEERKTRLFFVKDALSAMSGGTSEASEHKPE